MSQVREKKLWVWDIPVRLGHWLAVAVFIGMLASGYLGDPWLTWHLYGGMALLAWLAFRLAWGFIGSRHARFGDFVRGPKAIFSYIRAQKHGERVFFAGHNPLGGLSVLALLGAMAVQIASGLFATDDILFEGPLYCLVDSDQAGRMTGLHKFWIWVLLAVAGLHVAAVAFYKLVKKDDLVRPMILGYKKVPENFCEERPRPFASNWLAFALFLAASATVYEGLSMACAG